MPIAQNAHVLVVRYDQNGQPAVNVLGGVSDGDTALAQATVDQWLTNWWASIRSSVVDSTHLAGATYRHLASNFIREAAMPATPGANGGQPSQPLPSAVAPVIKWQSSQGGRAGRGRTFLVGAPLGFMDTQLRRVSTGGIQTVLSSANAYLSAYSSSTILKPAVISRRTGQAFPIVSAGVGPVLGIQRRRMR